MKFSGKSFATKEIKMKIRNKKKFLSTFSFFLFSFTINSSAAPFANNEFKKEDNSLENIKKNKFLKICSDAGFLPFEMKTKTGEWIGFDVDMMSEFSKSISVKLQMVQTSFDGIIPALISGKCDMIASGMTITPERKKIVSFSDPTFINGISIAIKNTEKNKTEYKDLSSLDKEGIKIAVRTGYTSDIYLSKNLKKAHILRFDHNSDLILSVMQGRAIAFISDTTYVNLMDERNKNRLIILPTEIAYEKISIAARKKDLELMKSFNQFLKNWKKNGGYDKAKKLYFEDKIWKTQYTIN